MFSYIRYRLGVAGLRNGQIAFSDDAIDAIHRYTSGIPRLINMLCDRVLVRSYQLKSRAVSRDIVSAAARELSGQFTVHGAPIRRTGTEGGLQ